MLDCTFGIIHGWSGNGHVLTRRSRVILHHVIVVAVTIFFSSHQIADVERVADQIAILDKSVLRANCSVETFQHKVKEVRLSFDGVPPDLPSIPGIIRMQTSENEWHLTLSNMNDDILEELKKFNPMQMETIDLSLEDAVASFLNRQGARTQLTQKLEELV